MEGQTVSHYRVLEKIGEGGMGQVYLAEDTSLERKVALKFLPMGLQTDPVAHKRFIREAKSAAAIDHPYICNIFEVAQTDEGDDFIVMEYVEGLTLKDRLDEGQLPIKEALQIGSEVAEALEKAHGAGVVHRDLKPSNIIITPEGHAKVLDFGLAKRITRDKEDLTSVLTREGTTLGTLAYMSPEQLRGSTVDTRSDVFSLGVVLYEMLTGIHPFSTGTQAETVNAILSEHPSTLSRYVQGAPDLLQHTLQKMLAKQPGERYQTVHEIRTNLTKVMEEITSPTPLAEPEKKSRRWLAAGVALILLVAFSLAVYFYPSGPASVGEEPIDSVAVLPFENVTGDEEIEYLSEGIPASISSSLSRILQLRIKPSSVLRRYREQEVDPQVVAEEQGVRAVVMGKFNLIGDTLSVSVELVDATKDQLLWGEQYNTALADLLDLQREVAGIIAGELRLQLTSDEHQQLVKQYTTNPSAHEAYLKGRFYLDLQERDAIEKSQTAIEFFERAVEEDSNYVLPYVSLSEAHRLMGFYLSSEEHYQKAREFARKALHTDGSYSGAHLGMGTTLASERDWLGAGVEFERALELDPNSQDPYGRYVIYLLFMGRREDAVTELERLRRISDPLSRSQQGIFGARNYYARQFDRALEIGRRFGDEWLIFQCYLAKDMYQEAFDMLLEGQIADGEDDESVEKYKAVYQASGIRGVLRLGMDEYLEGTVAPFDLARRYAFTHDKDEAFRWLDKAFELPLYLPFVTDIRFDSLRDDPRYEKFLRETMKLPEEAIAIHLSMR